MTLIAQPSCLCRLAWCLASRDHAESWNRGIWQVGEGDVILLGWGRYDYNHVFCSSGRRGMPRSCVLAVGPAAGQLCLPAFGQQISMSLRCPHLFRLGGQRFGLEISVVGSSASSCPRRGAHLWFVSPVAARSGGAEGDGAYSAGVCPLPLALVHAVAARSDSFLGGGVACPLPLPDWGRFREGRGGCHQKSPQRRDSFHRPRKPRPLMERQIDILLDNRANHDDGAIHDVVPLGETDKVKRRAPPGANVDQRKEMARVHRRRMCERPQPHVWGLD